MHEKFIFAMKVFSLSEYSLHLPAHSKTKASHNASKICAARWVWMTKKREALFQPEFIEDLRYWVETDRKLALRALEMIEAVFREPFEGIGKPEPLNI